MQNLTMFELKTISGGSGIGDIEGGINRCLQLTDFDAVHKCYIKLINELVTACSDMIASNNAFMKGVSEKIRNMHTRTEQVLDPENNSSKSEL